MAKGTCSVDGCERTEWAKALCGMHYQRVRNTGSPHRPKPTVEERFWAKVDKSGECWLWTGYIMPNGYGFWGYGHPVATKTTSHRFAYELTNGPIPDGLHIDHLCRVRACCRPDHLEAVTQAENNHRTRGTHCIRGHAMTDDNVYTGPRGEYRQCLSCMTLRNRGLL